MVKPRLRIALLTAGIAAGLVCACLAPAMAGAASYSSKMSCWYSSALCTEIADPQAFWGSWYVGHDEPSVEFYSHTPGSGNDQTYNLTLPKDPPGAYSPSNSYNFELRAAFWFGVAMCDNFSYPEQVSTCTPDSDTNIVNVRKSTKHPGTAFEELQFYPPGYVKQFAGFSCGATKWCAALNIDSLSEDPINGTTLNPTCQSRILGGIEYVNFAYLTLNGKPQGPPNPLKFDPIASGDPGPTVLYMNPGDNLTVSLHDSPNGLVTTVVDNTTHQTGFMTASASNGFGHIVYHPTGIQCEMVPYNFHPMYSTSTPFTTVPWAAHTYNVAFSDETGHFDFCSHIDPDTGACNGLEGMPGDKEAADIDDGFGCFAADMSTRYPVGGCLGGNDPGFDGPEYQTGTWPDGSPNTPTPVLFSSPITTGGAHYTNAAFEADMPRIEAADFGGSCNRLTGAGCTNPPPTDDGAPAAFYPYYSTVNNGGVCNWGEGASLPQTIDNFGGSSAEYGPLYGTWYYVFGGHGKTIRRFNNFHNTLGTNPC